MNTLSHKRRRQRLSRLVVPVLGAGVFVAWMLTLHSTARAQTPTPTFDCHPMADIVPPDPTYVPGEPFTLELRPRSGDWPTTPTYFRWRIQYNDFDEGVYGEQVQEFIIPAPGPDTAHVFAYAKGSGLEGVCSEWITSSGIDTTVRRFDYVPSPTPITPTPSPTPGCSPYPYDCVANIVSPPHGDVDQPTTVVLEHTGKEFLGFETVGGVPVDVTHLGGKRYLAENLDYLTIYVWYFIGAYSPCDGSPVVCMSLFRTVAEEEPTITPTPTPADGNAWILSQADVGCGAGIRIGGVLRADTGENRTDSHEAFMLADRRAYQASALENNLVVNCADYAIRIGEGDSALAWSPFVNPFGETPAQPGNPLVPVRNNMVWNCGTTLMQGDDWYRSNNPQSDVYGQFTSGIREIKVGGVTVAEEYLMNPEFVDLNNGDYRLGAFSPARAKGSPYRLDILPGTETSSNPMVMRRSIGAHTSHHPADYSGLSESP